MQFFERLSAEGPLILDYQTHQSHRSIASAGDKENTKIRAFSHCNHNVNNSPERSMSLREMRELRDRGMMMMMMMKVSLQKKRTLSAK